VEVKIDYGFRVALLVVQRNLRSYMRLRNWPWFRMWQKVKPMLNVTRVEDEMKALEDKAVKAQEAFEKEEKVRKELEVAKAKLEHEKQELLARLDAEAGNVADYVAKQQKLAAQKADLESQLTVSVIIFSPVLYLVVYFYVFCENL